MLRAVAVVALLATAAACSRPASSADAPAIRLITPPAETAYVEVTGLSSVTLDALDDARLTADDWAGVLRVAVSDDGPAVLGAYRVRDGGLRFVPAFPFDPGRIYTVRFDPSRVPGSSSTASAAVVTADVSRPGLDMTPSTRVAQVYPSGNEVPENLLRMYIEFSAPMGRRSGIEYLRLLDDRGREVEAPFLPLDYEFWSPDRRRFTVFFDPGRVKDGILPNQQMGRPLEAGRTYTLVLAREWRDGEGRPLVEEYRHTMRVGAARTQGLDPTSWRMAAPRAGSREPLVVTFPASLDRGLLMRALAVREADVDVAGDVRIEAGETRWVFTPGQPWHAGRYRLVALSILEDPAGNQVGRAFEVDNFDTVDKGPDAQTVAIPFVVRDTSTE